MRSRFLLVRSLLVIAALSASALTAPAHAQSPLAGDWLGKIDKQETYIEMSFDSIGGTLRGMWSCPTLDNVSRRVTTIRGKGDSVLIELNGVTTIFRAHQVGGPTPKLEGVWQEATKSYGLTLYKARAYVTGIKGATDSVTAVLKLAKTPQGTSIATFALMNPTIRIEQVPNVKNIATMINFTVPKLSASFTGQRSKDDMEIVGSMEEGKQKTAMTFHYDPKPHMLRRPQEPVPPLPYASRAVTFRNDMQAVELSGTYTEPAGNRPYPVVLLVGSTGAPDRDGTMLEHKPLAVLADFLTQHGFATLRVDPRGKGESHGAKNDATIIDLSSDVKAAISYLRSRSDVDNRRIGVIGMGDGALVAGIAVMRDSAIRFLVSMGGPGLDGDRTMQHQREEVLRRSGVSEVAIRAQAARLQPIDHIITTTPRFDQIDEKVDLYLKEVRDSATATIAKGDTNGKAQLRSAENIAKFAKTAMLSLWYKSYVRVFPSRVFGELRAPMLAIAGSLDKQFEPDANIAAIGDALKQVNNRDSKTQIYPGLNHYFQRAITGEAKEISTIEETMSPRVLIDVDNWIVAHSH